MLSTVAIGATDITGATPARTRKLIEPYRIRIEWNEQAPSDGHHDPEGEDPGADQECGTVHQAPSHVAPANAASGERKAGVRERRTDPRTAGEGLPGRHQR